MESIKCYLCSAVTWNILEMEDHILTEHADIFRPIEGEKADLTCPASDYLVPDCPVLNSSVSDYPDDDHPVSDCLYGTNEVSPKKTEIEEKFDTDCGKVKKESDNLESRMKTKLALVIIEGKQCFECLGSSQKKIKYCRGPKKLFTRKKLIKFPNYCL